eukprot:6857089-Prymnesium_polylepis.1
MAHARRMSESFGCARRSRCRRQAGVPPAWRPEGGQHRPRRALMRCLPGTKPKGACGIPDDRLPEVCLTFP